MTWAYDSASRTVYDTDSGDAVCILSDLASVRDMHYRGALIAMVPKITSLLADIAQTLQRATDGTS